MKITTQKKEISPVTITLETVGELVAMWHRMNISGSDVKDNTTDVDTFNKNEDWNLSQQIFDFVDEELERTGIRPGSKD